MLIALGILEPVTHSEWAAPCVIVPKANNSVRICGDYKVTINPYLDVDKYPLPTPQDLFATLAGGKYFTTLDLSQAYHQMEVDKDSRKYLTINTHRGLMYTRLPYSIASAPSLFQNAMDQVLQGMEGVICYIDVYIFVILMYIVILYLLMVLVVEFLMLFIICMTLFLLPLSMLTKLLMILLLLLV